MRAIQSTSTAGDQVQNDSDTLGLLDTIIDQFGRYRLLTFDHDPIARSPTVEVAHVALIREWQRLRHWLDDGRADIRLQRLLALATVEWLQACQDDSYLLRGTRLNQFEDWATITNIALTQDEQAYLDTSLAARTARRQDEAARQQRELESAQRLAEAEQRRAEEQVKANAKLRQRAIFLSGALIVAAVLAVVAGLFGQRASQETAERITAEAVAVAEANERATAQANAESRRVEAEQPAQVALANQLAAQSLSLLDDQFNVAVLLGVEANNILNTFQSRSTLPLSQTLAGHIGGVTSVAFSPDGTILASGGCAEFDASEIVYGDSQTCLQREIRL